MKLTFKNVNVDTYEQLKAKLATVGVAVNDHGGKISERGIKGSYARNPTAETLEITVDKTPFLIPKNLVVNKIMDTVVQYGGQMHSLT